MYSIEITSNAAKEIRKLNNPILQRILNAIEALSEEPRPNGSVKLSGADDLWCIRVGDYRIVYNIEDEIKIVTVTRVAHRRKVYDNL